MTVQGFSHPGIIPQVQQFLGKGELGLLVPLRGQPGLQGAGGQVLTADDFESGASLGILQAQQNGPALHAITVSNQNILDDAPFEMLDGLAVGLHRDHTSSDRRAIQVGNGGPAAEAGKSN